MRGCGPDRETAPDHTTQAPYCPSQNGGTTIRGTSPLQRNGPRGLGKALLQVQSLHSLSHERLGGMRLALRLWPAAARLVTATVPLNGLS
jgi:hypothetical protein